MPKQYRIITTEGLSIRSMEKEINELSEIGFVVDELGVSRTQYGFINVAVILSREVTLDKLKQDNQSIRDGEKRKNDNLQDSQEAT